MVSGRLHSQVLCPCRRLPRVRSVELNGRKLHRRWGWLGLFVGFQGECIDGTPPPLSRRRSAAACSTSARGSPLRILAISDFCNKFCNRPLPLLWESGSYTICNHRLGQLLAKLALSSSAWCCATSAPGCPVACRPQHYRGLGGWGAALPARRWLRLDRRPLRHQHAAGWSAKKRGESRHCRHTSRCILYPRLGGHGLASIADALDWFHAEPAVAAAHHPNGRASTGEAD